MPIRSLLALDLGVTTGCSFWTCDATSFGYDLIEVLEMNCSAEIQVQAELATRFEALINRLHPTIVATERPFQNGITNQRKAIDFMLGAWDMASRNTYSDVYNISASQWKNTDAGSISLIEFAKNKPVMYDQIKRSQHIQDACRIGFWYLTRKA